MEPFSSKKKKKLKKILKTLKGSLINEDNPPVNGIIQ